MWWYEALIDTIFKHFWCCETENLNTDDDNWEKGHVNYFVGHQIDACENFPMAYEGNWYGLCKRTAKIDFFWVF